MRLAVPLALFAALVLAAYAPTPAPRALETAPADSTEWVNLQILPDSLTRDELIGRMRGFTAALGVGCDHCHARGDDGLDFPSDANPHKDVARGMMRMTWQINQEILPAIDGLHGEGDMLVTCYTCHRGAARPETVAPPREPQGSRPAPEPEHNHGDGSLQN
ncbi:c-type cytochrome [Rubrivirga sp. IMCC45206]|uniref:c-type cytochrome n=1 Tax=Rubrivirga sp. IMCC45206 TaxID=3391614 RepID=UPI00398FF907